MNIVNLKPMRTELSNIHIYLKYLSDTVNNLLQETPAEHMYQAAWLSKCLNLEEILIIFQNQFINKREKFNLVLDKTLKELNSDIDIKMQTIDTDPQTNLIEANDNETTILKEHLQKKIEIIDTAMITNINAINNELTALKEGLQKRFEIIESTMINFDAGIHAINNCLQEIINKEPVLLEQKENTDTPLKTPKSWSIHVDEVKQKMKEKQWGEHEVCELAKINFNSFRKFQKKDPKLSNTIVNKILKLFDIVN